MAFPIVGAVRGATNADVEHCDPGRGSPCRPAPPVNYTGTILENALVGVLFDVAALALISTWAPHVGLDPTL